MAGKFAKVTQSFTATTAVNGGLRGQLQKARGAWWGKALLVGSLAVGLIPAVGVPISYALDRRRNRVIEKKQKEVLTDYYRDQVAAQLGIDPAKVSVNDLELAAQVNPTIANAIEKVTAEKKSANRATGFASAGAAAVGFIPGVGGITNGLAKGAIHLGGSVAGSTVSSLMDKDELTTLDVMEHIDDKRNKGQPINSVDIMLLRIAQDPEFQKEFKKKNGRAFHKLSEAEQQAVMASMPDMVLGADRQADAVNRGLISPQNLVMAGPESTSNFAASVGNRPASQSFAAAITAERAAAAAAANQR